MSKKADRYETKDGCIRRLCGRSSLPSRPGNILPFWRTTPPRNRRAHATSLRPFFMGLREGWSHCRWPSGLRPEAKAAEIIGDHRRCRWVARRAKEEGGKEEEEDEDDDDEEGGRGRGRGRGRGGGRAVDKLTWLTEPSPNKSIPCVRHTSTSVWPTRPRRSCRTPR